MRLIVGIVKKDNQTFMSFSIKNLVKRIFKWIHKKLSQLEDFILNKFDEWGKKAEEKLIERFGNNYQG